MRDDALTHDWEGPIALLDTPTDDHRLLINAYGRVLDRFHGHPLAVMLARHDAQYIRVGRADGFLIQGNELRAIGSVDLALIEQERPDVATAMREGRRIPVALTLREACATQDRDEIETSIRRGLAAALLRDDLDQPAGQRPHLDEPDIENATDQVFAAYDRWQPHRLLLDMPSPWAGVGIELDDFTGSLDIRTLKPLK